MTALQRTSATRTGVDGSQWRSDRQGEAVGLGPDRGRGSRRRRGPARSRSPRSAGTPAGTGPRLLHWPLTGVTVGLSLFGVVMVFSAARGPTGDLGFGARQAVFLGTGSALMVVVARLDYRRLHRWWPLLLGSALASLVVVLTPAGTEVRGTQGWFRIGGIAVQPSEFAKLGLIIGLAVILRGAPQARVHSTPGLRSSSAVDRPVSRPGSHRFGLSIALLGSLSALVLAQGESGTVLVYCAVALGMLTVAGVPKRYLVLLTVSGIVVIGLALTSGILAPYQVDRFEAFLDADLDPQGIGYNQQQALTAIGSGGLLGAGLFRGPQTQLGYLPDQHTDFIFAAVAEELGFAGATAILVLEGAILAFVLLVAVDCRDRFGRLLCAGVFSLLAFQLLQNVAMNLRLMPITGISLPFVSYGGSSLLTSLIAVGLVQSVAVQRGRRSGDRPPIIGSGASAGPLRLRRAAR